MDNLFKKCVLELNFATINGLGESSCKNHSTLLISYCIYEDI